MSIVLITFYRFLRSYSTIYLSYNRKQLTETQISRYYSKLFLKFNQKSFQLIIKEQKNQRMESFREEDELTDEEVVNLLIAFNWLSFFAIIISHFIDVYRFAVISRKIYDWRNDRQRQAHRDNYILVHDFEPLFQFLHIIGLYALYISSVKLFIPFLLVFTAYSLLTFKYSEQWIHVHYPFGWKTQKDMFNTRCVIVSVLWLYLLFCALINRNVSLSYDRKVAFWENRIYYYRNFTIFVVILEIISFVVKHSIYRNWSELFEFRRGFDQFRSLFLE